MQQYFGNWLPTQIFQGKVWHLKQSEETRAEKFVYFPLLTQTFIQVQAEETRACQSGEREREAFFGATSFPPDTLNTKRFHIIESAECS